MNFELLGYLGKTYVWKTSQNEFKITKINNKFVETSDYKMNIDIFLKHLKNGDLEEKNPAS